MSRCLICGSQTAEFISFGPMPVANGFLTPDTFAQERFLPRLLTRTWLDAETFREPAQALDIFGTKE